MGKNRLRILTIAISIIASVTASAKCISSAPYEIGTKSSVVMSHHGNEDDPLCLKDVCDILGQDENVYWIKGTIAGCAKKVSETNNDNGIDNELVPSNLVLIDNTTSASVPVALTTKTTARALLNLVDHPENLGKEIMVKGTVQKYFYRAGVKSVKDAKIIGTSSVLSVPSQDIVSTAVYTIHGQQRPTLSKGLNIVRYTLSDGTTKTSKIIIP